MGFLSPRSLLLSNVNTILFPRPPKLPVMSVAIVEDEPWEILDEKISQAWIKYLQQMPSHTAIEAAEKLNALVPTNRTEEEEEEEEEEDESLEFFLVNVWYVLLEMVRAIPPDHVAQDKLVEMVKALRDLPTNTVVEIWSNETKIWKDLPFLGYVLDEDYNSQ